MRVVVLRVLGRREGLVRFREGMVCGAMKTESGRAFSAKGEEGEGVWGQGDVGVEIVRDLQSSVWYHSESVKESSDSSSPTSSKVDDVGEADDDEAEEDSAEDAKGEPTRFRLCVLVTSDSSSESSSSESHQDVTWSYGRLEFVGVGIGVGTRGGGEGKEYVSVSVSPPSAKLNCTAVGVGVFAMHAAGGGTRKSLSSR